jgi:hypothetical protein
VAEARLGLFKDRSDPELYAATVKVAENLIKTLRIPGNEKCLLNGDILMQTQ